jgi:histidinol-phosphate/aromatic aminotransferase/cobyric acid decarboxylase-like protein
MIKKNIQDIDRPHWAGLLPRVEKVEAGYTNLDRNENHDEVLAEHIQKAIKHFIPLDSAMFYADYYRFYEMFAEYYNCNMDNLLITAGCDEAIRLSFEATLSKYSVFLTIAPTYRGSISNSADLCDNIITCSEDEEDIVAHLDKYKPTMFYICSPNNPTGKVYSFGFLKYICKTFPNTTIFVDNTYRPFCNENYQALINQPNCLIGFSYSKSWGLAGARLGLLQGHKDIISHVTKIRANMSVSSITLRLAEYLHNNHYIVDKSLERNVAGIHYAHEYFKDCKIYSMPTLNHIVFEPTEEIIKQLDSCKILYGKAGEFSDTAIRLTTLPVEQFEKLICLDTSK